MTFRNGLDSLLRPEDSVLVLIDHQPYQLANVNSHDPQAVVNNTVIDRTFINTWEDKPTVDAVKATGRKQLVIAGLWTEVCVAMPRGPTPPHFCRTS